MTDIADNTERFSRETDRRLGAMESSFKNLETNMGSSIKNLERQIGQVVDTIRKNEPERFPS